MRVHSTILTRLLVLFLLGVSLSACQRSRATPILGPSISEPSTFTQQAPTIVTTVHPALPTLTQAFVTLTQPAYPTPTGSGSANLPTDTPSTANPVISEPVTATSTLSAYPVQPIQNNTPTTEQLSLTPISTTPVATQQALAPTATTILASPTIANTAGSQYPGPGISPVEPTGYPAPITTPIASPGIATATYAPTPVVTGQPSMTQIGTAPPTYPPAPTAIPGTAAVVPTELPPKPPISPPPPGSSVTIWHSWSSLEVSELQSIIQSFQKIYPDVIFSLQYYPQDDLYGQFEEAAYLGGGPDLLLGPAKWGASLYDEELLADLLPYVPLNFLSSINPSALNTGRYQQALISLPLSQRGMLMFRNELIIKTAPVTFAELDKLSHQATHGGLVGSYLERGSQFSSADIVGLGGKVMDADGYPAFNNEFGLEWFQLLADYDTAGAVTFNTNWDLEMFKRGRVGIIIDGSWNISQFSQIISAENLAIDPWPDYGNGNLSGWIEADSVFLNSNTTGDNRFAALSFMGYLLDPNVQARLAEVGHIPTVIATKPRDPLILQAMEAFKAGATYPAGIDDQVIKLYQEELDAAIINVFVKGMSPAEALKIASNNITSRLKNLLIEP